MPAWIRRLRARLKYRHFEDDLDEEIGTHRSLAADEHARAGAPAADAGSRAMRDLGNVTLAREDSRAVWLPALLQQFVQDARYGFRSLRRERGFTTAAVLMLTLGLGLVAIGFTMYYGLFHRPWNVPDASRVFLASVIQPPGPGRVDDGFTYAGFKLLRERAKTADYAVAMPNWHRVSGPEVVESPYVPFVYFVSDGFLETLHAPMQLGTGLGSRASDDDRVAVLTDRSWRNYFNADPNVLGKTVKVFQTDFTVVGVLAPGLDGFGPRRVALFMPLATAPLVRKDSPPSTVVLNEHSCCVSLMGRAREGFTRDQVREELALLTNAERAERGLAPVTVDLFGTAPFDGRGAPTGMMRVIGLIAAGVVLVLILTCANVGNLHLARSLRRQREIVVRLSLGASRPRIIRQLLTEGLVLAGLAGALAWLATMAVPALMELADEWPDGMYVSDWRVGALTATLTAIACLIVSLAPALQTTRVSWRGAAATISARTGRTRGVLLAVQIAIAMVLILTATLIARGIHHAATSTSDFAMQTTIAARVSTRDELTRERFNAIWSGLEAAAASSELAIGIADVIPVSNLSGISTSVRPAGTNIDYRADLMPMNARSFAVLQVPLVRGRWASDDSRAREAVINELLAEQIWPGADPIGKAIQIDFDDSTVTIVGVARNAHLRYLGEIRPLVHTPPMRVGMPALLVTDSPDVTQRLAALVQGVDPSLRLVDANSLAHLARSTLDNALLGAATAGALGLVALALAVVGIFGVFSYIIEERRREIGIRLALGAGRRDIRRSIARASRGALVGGVAGGLALSAIVGMALQGLLFGLSPADPISYALVAVLLLAAAIAAMYVPVRRALRTDPAATLRAE
ncbi:MAG TPA: ABC transporter permease [Vicinamibacterales bacterium]|nr:ABC transporter permease [Vicinamibacterales bacterium]